eukprot:1750966-Amphidinium_carterae.1
MRAIYLAQARMDVSETVKCLSKAMSAPRAGHLLQHNRLARYLKGAPRCVLEFRLQAPAESHLRVYVDGDWAGDTVTRRSTTGMVLQRGFPHAAAQFYYSERHWTE